MAETQSLAAAAAHTPYVPAVVAWGSEPCEWMLMELAPEGSLFKLVFAADCSQRYLNSGYKGVVMPEVNLRWYSSRLLHAVCGLRAAGLVHRDLKSANVFMGSGGVPLVGDMGLAAPVDAEGRLVDAAGEVVPLPRRVGSPGHRAPELELYDEEYKGYDASVDVFGLGRMLLDLAFGPGDGTMIYLGDNPMPEDTPSQLRGPLEGLLAPRQQRLSLRQVRGHAWLQGHVDMDGLAAAAGQPSPYEVAACGPIVRPRAY